MGTFFRIAAIFLALGTLGNLLDGEFSILALILAVVCAYFGWGHDFSKKQSGNNNDVINSNRNDNIVSDPFNDIARQYTTSEKQAFLCCLFVVAASDDDIDIMEIEFLETMARVLKYSPFQISELVKLANTQKDTILHVLGKFNETQKNHLIIAIEDMIYADGKDLEVEYKFVYLILIQIGITPDQYNEVTKMNYLLREKYENHIESQVEHTKNNISLFNYSEKEVVLTVLYAIATVDGELDAHEVDCLNDMAENLNYKPFLLKEIAFSRATKLGNCLAVASHFNLKQKIYIINKVEFMTNCNGRIYDVEFDDVTYLLHKAGISEELYVEVTENLRTLIKQLKEK